MAGENDERGLQRIIWLRYEKQRITDSEESRKNRGRGR